MILRLLNVQGIAGLAASACLALLLVLQKGETRHWRKQSGQFEQLYRDEQSARAATVANYVAAAETARAADRAASERARMQQQAINERSSHDYEVRLADARARARALRLPSETGAAATNPRSGGAAAMPRLYPAPGGPVGTTEENRLPAADALTATEQAIQLDELINWIRAQAEVDPNSR